MITLLVLLNLKASDRYIGLDKRCLVMRIITYAYNIHKAHKILQTQAGFKLAFR